MPVSRKRKGSQSRARPRSQSRPRPRTRSRSSKKSRVRRRRALNGGSGWLPRKKNKICPAPAPATDPDTAPAPGLTPSALADPNTFKYDYVHGVKWDKRTDQVKVGETLNSLDLLKNTEEFLLYNTTREDINDGNDETRTQIEIVDESNLGKGKVIMCIKVDKIIFNQLRTHADMTYTQTVGTETPTYYLFFTLCVSTNDITFPLSLQEIKETFFVPENIMKMKIAEDAKFMSYGDWWKSLKIIDTNSKAHTWDESGPKRL